MGMPYHQQVLIDAIKLAIKLTGMSASDIASISGVNGSSLSRFLNAKQDLKAGDYFAVLNSLPELPRKLAYQQLGIAQEFDLVTLVLAASPKEKVDVLNAIGAWVLETRDSNETERIAEAV